MANELWIYDTIGEGFFSAGVTAKAVRDDLAKMDTKQRLTVRINSPGGDVFEAVAINALLSEWKGGVDVQVDGLAASAASYIATVGDKVTMAEGSMLMIHDPWTVAVGNAEEMQRAADTLDKIADNLVGAYSRKSGLASAEVRDIMRAETWLTADEAVAKGFASAIGGDKAKACAVSKEMRFKNVPAAYTQTNEPILFVPRDSTTDGSITIPTAVAAARTVAYSAAKNQRRIDWAKMENSRHLTRAS